MGLAQKLLAQFRQPGFNYAAVIFICGICMFLTIDNSAFFSYSLTQWVTVYAMVAAVLILEHFMFQLPPEGNRQSMDSSVYLAAAFAYGASFSLVILVIASAILLIYKRDVVWWKHLLNFSIYSFMIFGASLAYHLLGGAVGPFDVHHLHAYIIALAVYFLVNVVLVGCYYYLLYKGKLYEIIKTILADAFFAYFSTLLLSLVLVILIIDSGLFGLFLLLAVGMLLSHGFRQLFLMYSQMSEKANTDQRTGLFSHSYFEEKLDEHIKRARTENKPMSLALLDLDDFKKYNDAFGHPQGDRLLGFFGQLVKAECEANQLFAARYGGEEFSIIMPGFHKDKAKEFIDGLRKKINDTPFDGVDVFPHGCISFSAGILEVNKESYDKSQLIDWADRALYVAKSKGKNTVFIHGDETHLPQSLEYDLKQIEQQIKIFISKDVYTFKHSKRVCSYAADMADRLQLHEEERRLLVLGALIHDIGKLEIPRDILNKKTKLTNEEWEMVKKHVVWGKEIVLVNEKYKDLVPLVELHHERYDGKGYPHGLKGEEIPRLARLLCIIDSFDAMTTERPYQETKSVPDALQELRRCSGTQFDPELVELFITYIETSVMAAHSEVAAAAQFEI
ncbi:diguanylate cyclase [Cohnella pontilimi]|uniref:Diguanylate cyclase n=1 Tax=Cohnella pontilimi TaxID=2564100 RepID=A0A4U0FGQ1_9BACL|nr:diguanylate cyclase [Cohnella pontilimi]TJY43574.1 diguanylate cyclase [Cohnella pontilimi]